MFSNEGFNISRRITLVRSISPKISLGGSISRRCLNAVSKRSTSSVNSLSNNSAFLPSATVLTITPKFLGRILSISLFKRFRSSTDFIFCDTDTFSEKGIRTRWRPAILNSEVKRGPLVEIGSFATCTATYWPTESTSPIFPFLLISGSSFNLATGIPFRAIHCFI